MKKKQTRATSSHWGAFNVVTENDRIVDVEAFPNDPSPSNISSILPKAIYHRTRVAKPAIRRSWLEAGDNIELRAPEKRGKDEFIELPWDEALDITAKELQRVKDQYGNNSIFGGSYGWASAGRFHHALGQVHRFLNGIGGYVSSVASYSTAAAQAIIPHVLGSHFLKITWGEQNSWPMIAEHTRTLVMFGGINPKNSQVSMGGVTHHETHDWFEQFEKRGIRRINISPQSTDTPAGAEWMPIIPGTDTALMMAIAYILETENLLDRNFLATCTVGYEKFAPYLLGDADGQAKTPDWASQICGIDASEIITLARTMATERTLITIAWSLQRAEHGEQPFWMATVLAAMLGQIGLPGGGIGYGYGAIGGVGVPVKRLSGLTFPQGENPIKDFIPVARIADMLLKPGEDFEFNGQNLTYPDIRLVYWCGGNPFHHHQDLNRLSQAWQKPETIIVNEPWWTATAQRADIVFPATTPYEREDIGRAQGDSYLFHMPKFIEPVNEARNDYDIFAALSKRLGVEEQFTEGRSSEDWIQHLYKEFEQKTKSGGIDVPSLASLKSQNWVDLPIRGYEHSQVPFSAFRDNPTDAPLGTPSGKIEIFSQTIANFNYDDCPGHPVWHEPTEWLGSDLSNQFPLHLVSPQPGDKLHSQMESAIADIPDKRPASLTMSSEDAEKRKLNHGDIARVFNQRGSVKVRIDISDEIRSSVVSLQTGAWFDPDSQGTDNQGNPNVLTLDIGTSRIGQGPSAHSCLVDVEKYLLS
jgi:biotin/methionine sulfoxide reductase